MVVYYNSFSNHSHNWVLLDKIGYYREVEWLNWTFFETTQYLLLKVPSDSKFTVFGSSIKMYGETTETLTPLSFSAGKRRFSCEEKLVVTTVESAPPICKYMFEFEDETRSFANASQIYDLNGNLITDDNGLPCYTVIDNKKYLIDRIPPTITQTSSIIRDGKFSTDVTYTYHDGTINRTYTDEIPTDYYFDRDIQKTDYKISIPATNVTVSTAGLIDFDNRDTVIPNSDFMAAMIDGVVYQTKTFTVPPITKYINTTFKVGTESVTLVRSFELSAVVKDMVATCTLGVDGDYTIVYNGSTTTGQTVTYYPFVYPITVTVGSGTDSATLSGNLTGDLVPPVTHDVVSDYVTTCLFFTTTFEMPGSYYVCKNKVPIHEKTFTFTKYNDIYVGGVIANRAADGVFTAEDNAILQGETAYLLNTEHTDIQLATVVDKERDTPKYGDSMSMSGYTGAAYNRYFSHYTKGSKETYGVIPVILKIEEGRTYYQTNTSDVSYTALYYTDPLKLYWMDTRTPNYDHVNLFPRTMLVDGTKWTKTTLMDMN